MYCRLCSFVVGVLQCIHSIFKVFFYLTYIIVPSLDFMHPVVEYVFSTVSYLIFMHICFICNIQPFYFCTLFVESFLSSSSSFVLNFIAQCLLLCTVRWHCFCFLSSCQEFNVIHFLFLCLVFFGVISSAAVSKVSLNVFLHSHFIHYTCF